MEHPSFSPQGYEWKAVKEGPHRGGEVVFELRSRETLQKHVPHTGGSISLGVRVQKGRTVTLDTGCQGRTGKGGTFIGPP